MIPTKTRSETKVPNQNWSTVTDAEGHFQQTEKRLGMQERRPKINKASDLLGPLSGPSAVLLDDSLSSPLLGFNGLFIVPPDTVDSPDDTKWWIGQSIAQDGVGGIQVLRTFRPADAPQVSKMRGWETVAGSGGLRAYSDWQDIDPPSDPYVPPAPGARRDLSSKLDPAFTVVSGHSFQIRSDGIWREVHGYITGTIGASSTAIIASGLDSGDRPTDEAWGGAYLAGGFVGAARVTPTGDVSLTNPDATSRSGGRFTVVYTVDV